MAEVRSVMENEVADITGSVLPYGADGKRIVVSDTGTGEPRARRVDLLKRAPLEKAKDGEKASGFLELTPDRMRAALLANMTVENLCAGCNGTVNDLVRCAADTKVLIGKVDPIVGKPLSDMRPSVRVTYVCSDEGLEKKDREIQE